MRENMNNKAQWISSTENNYWNNSDISFSTKENIKPDIIINENICYQTMDETPWGGCFADRGYMAMEKMIFQTNINLIMNIQTIIPWNISACLLMKNIFFHT